ncbi:hypothetical protein ACWGFX_08345 [Streptomyces xanthophaeus]|uniref:Uncharacterized protein n=1 Tax=Streptomyces xanthophaeus TaxID=67385 RepID=A0A919GUL5_9ACTN|nr:hypothetical protein [Streptomyces xanthophaeus]GHI82931.1 hypothetical protein Sxan_02950 [Streptomyces xanthophaeus]
MKDPFSSAEASTLQPPVGSVDRDAARRAVADRAIDRADLTRLLDLLGLWPGDDPPARGMASASADPGEGPSGTLEEECRRCPP